MPIELQKPLGTDIYDIDVFNANSTTIENYLNQLVNSSDISFKIYSYPKYNTAINIDDLIVGIHICNNLLASDITGTLPDPNSGIYFVILSIKDDTSDYQIFFNASNSSNEIYIRSKIPNNDGTLSEWSDWKKLGEGGIAPEDQIDVELVDL